MKKYTAFLILTKYDSDHSSIAWASLERREGWFFIDRQGYRASSSFSSSDE